MERKGALTGWARGSASQSPLPSFQTLALWVAHGAFLQIAVETAVMLRCGAVEEVPVVFSPCLMHPAANGRPGFIPGGFGVLPFCFVLLSLTPEPSTRQNELWFYSASFDTCQLLETSCFSPPSL